MKLNKRVLSDMSSLFRLPLSEKRNNPKEDIFMNNIYQMNDAFNITKCNICGHEFANGEIFEKVTWSNGQVTSCCESCIEKSAVSDGACTYCPNADRHCGSWCWRSPWCCNSTGDGAPGDLVEHHHVVMVVL